MDLNQTVVTMSFSFQEVLALLPCFLLGLGSGVASYFHNYIIHKDYDGSWRKFLGTALSSMVIAFIVFALLDMTDFSFISKLALSSAVSFLGIDKALELAQKIVTLRSSK